MNSHFSGISLMTALQAYLLKTMETARSVLLLIATLAILAGVAAGKTLMLGGGYISDSNSLIWNKAVSLAGGRGVARIGILTAASSQPISQGREYKALFESYGVAEAYWIPIHENNKGAAMEEEVIKNIKRMTGFFFGGGAVQKYIENLLMEDRQPTPAFAAIRDMYNNGTPVIGNSAGAMIMSTFNTIVEGTSYGALKSGALKVGDATNVGDLVYDPEGGFGFIDGHIIDSHFHERGRQGRLVRLLSDTRKMANGTSYGIGIDEETAFILTNVGTKEEIGEVFGKGGVFYVDASKSYVDDTLSNWRILNVYCHYAIAGDMIDMTDHTITFAKNMRPIKGNETADYAATSSDIFQQTLAGSTSEFRKVANSLFNSRFDSITYGITSEDSPPFFVILTEDSRSLGYVEIEADTVKISYKDIKMEIRPVVEDINDDE